MYELTMNEASTLQIPLQAAPVDRTPAGAAAFNAEAGVDASIDWGAIGNTLLQAAPGVLGALGW